MRATAGFTLLKQLLALHRPPIQGEYLLDRLGSGMPDDQWVRAVAEDDPPVLVLTGDNARARGASPRLPLLLPEFGITSVYFAPRMQQEPTFVKIRSILVLLPEIQTAYEGERGLRYRIHSHGDTFRLQKWPLTQ